MPESNVSLCPVQPVFWKENSPCLDIHGHTLKHIQKSEMGRKGNETMKPCLPHPTYLVPQIVFVRFKEITATENENWGLTSLGKSILSLSVKNESAAD